MFTESGYMRFIAILLVVLFVPITCVAMDEDAVIYGAMYADIDYEGRKIIYGDKEITDFLTFAGFTADMAHWYYYQSEKIITSGAYRYTKLDDGTIAILCIDPSRQDETLTIPREIDGIVVSRLGLDVNTGTRAGFWSLSERVKKVIIPDNITVVGAKMISSRTSNIREIVYAEGVEEIGGIGGQSVQVKKITLPTKSLKTLGDYAFTEVTCLKQCKLPEGLSNIGFGAFMNSTVQSVSFPSTVETVGDYMFLKCEKLKSVTFKEGIPRISEGMFAGCVNLAKITIPKSVIIIGEYAFENCSKLSAVKFSGNQITEIPCAAFRRCKTLSKIDIPAGVTRIGEDAFYGCAKLSSVSIPESVTSISAGAFEGCSNRIVFTVSEGSYADEWAKTNGYKVKTANKK